MARLLRGLVAATVLAAVVSTTATAQDGRQYEVRMDFVSVLTSDGATQIGVAFPGQLALGIYLNQNIAIEPSVGYQHFSNGASGGDLHVGLALPYYFAGDFGKTGFFIAPAVSMNKGTGDFDTDAQVNYGVDAGIKVTYRDRISTRWAAVLRDGDSFGEMAFGVSAGVGIFFR